jgi:hypothetical protein
MVFLLFLGSLITLELILRSDARAERRAESGQGLSEQLPASLLDVAGPGSSSVTDPGSMLALMQAVEQHGPPVQPETEQLECQEHL